MRSIFGKWAAALRRRRVKAESEPSELQKETAAEQLKQSDTQPVIQQCLNCLEPLSGAFCHKCGQKDDDLRRPVWTFFRELLDAVFGADSKILKTIFLLILVPGGLTRAFMMGRRARFLPPLRLYVVLSFVFFITLNITDVLILDISVKPKVGAEEVHSSAATPEETSAEGDISEQAPSDFAPQLIEGMPPETIGQASPPLAEGALQPPEGVDEPSVEALIDQLIEDAGGNENEIGFAKRRARIQKILDDPSRNLSALKRGMLEKIVAVDLAKLEAKIEGRPNLTVNSDDFPYDFDIAMFVVNGHQDREGVKQEDIEKLLADEDKPQWLGLAMQGFGKALKNPKEFNDLINDWLPWAMVFLMPVMALILRAFHWGGRRYYLNQLVFALHFHSFLFVFLTAFAVLVPIFGGEDALATFWIGTSLYLIVALKVGEDQGWIRAFLKAGFIWVGYSFIMTITMMGVMFWGLQDI